MLSSRSIVLVLAVAAASLLLYACAGSTPPSTDPVRLIDEIAEATIEGSPVVETPNAHAANWTFEEGLNQWSAAIGIDDLRIDGNALTGRTTMPDPGIGPAPGIAVALPPLPLDDVWAVEVRARISAGANLSARFGQGEELDLEAVFSNPMGIFQTPLQPGEEMHDYSIRPSNPLSVGEQPGHLVLSPSDVAGAEFAIERIRLVLRKEHLNSVPSGPSWQGLGETYRETIVSRSPETLHFDVDLPAKPFLELSVGTIEAGDSTFHLEVTSNNQPAKKWQYTVTEPNEWNAGRLDLAELGGQSVGISLHVEGPQDGTLGLWGAPAVRSGAAGSASKNAKTADAAGQPQGVILIITDTLRRDHLDVYGYERVTAPAMGKMASEGVRFGDAISQATWTKVSVPAIQTGLYPTTHTVKSLPDRLPASAKTIAETFRDAGYATFGLISIPFVGRMTNLHQGYETLQEPGAMGDAGDLVNGGTTKSSLLLVPRLLDWLDQRQGSKFFALLHVADAHSPFRPAPEHELYFAQPGEMDQLDEYTDKVRPFIKHPLMQQFGMPRREELVQADVVPGDFVHLEENGLDGSIKGMDEQIGKLFERLDQLGLRDKVIVALVADHGTELLEHDDHFHGHSVYGELNRVPMLLWGPSFVPSGANVAETVQTIDLMPTMLDVAGLPLPENIQGQSLRSLWSDSEPNWRRPAITEMPWNFRGPVGWSLISDGWKLVRLGPLGEEPTYQLYNHVEDPINLHNVASENPEIVTRLAKMLDGWHAEAIAARLNDSTANAALDSAELERLRSLGYVQ